MRFPKSKKGFYLVSPFLGTFFFLITVSIAALFMTENAQQVETAKAGGGNELIFISYTIQADAFDVYLQNYLQQILDTYVVGGSDPIVTQITNVVTTELSTDLRNTYQAVYQNAFEIHCDVVDKAWSKVIVTFNGQRGAKVLNCPDPFCPPQKTAIWPYASRYALECEIEEPPIEAGISFKSRWYYLNGSNICEQAPNACIGHSI
jgi:hypothetical protein